MNLPERSVIIKNLPQDSNVGSTKTFLRDLTQSMAEVIRPAVVIDCSRASRIDRSALHLLLCCLEEAMKRNGDVRLAGINRVAWKIFESAGAAHFFKNFATVGDAVESYGRPALDRVPSALPSTITTANAA